MANELRTGMTTTLRSLDSIGSDILNLITTGLYNNPLAIYREYIQNSADALAYSGHREDGKVVIHFDHSAASVTIRDTGPGLSPQSAKRALLPIAKSEKEPRANRGFRGIGRLSGLAFGKSVVFLTRARGDRTATRVEWDGQKIREGIYQRRPIEQVLKETVTIQPLTGSDFPSHFFEVQVNGIARHAIGMILNKDAVRKYIGEVCPVPISPLFPFATQIDDLFQAQPPPFSLNVILDDATNPVTRLFSNAIRFSDEKIDHFKDFQEITIPSVDRKGLAALGWIAHSSYLGTIPREHAIRSFRARAGNIQVGNETIFDHLFFDDRFNRWCVGELHIMDSRILPNARRDYFEPGPHIRNLENHLIAIFGEVVARCRKASAERNKERRLQSVLREIEDAYHLAQTGYLSTEDSITLITREINHVQDVRDKWDAMSTWARTELEKLEKKLRGFQVLDSHLPVANLSRLEAATYRKLFRALAETSPSARAAKETIEAVLTHLQRRVA